MSGHTSSVEQSGSVSPNRYRWWHAAMFWLAINAPGWLFPWREVLFPGFREPALRPPGEVFPVVWFVITVSALCAGLRVVNDRLMNRRYTHVCLQATFWFAYAVFPLFFFGLSSPVVGFVLTFGIFVIAVAEVVLLWSDDRWSALLLLPLLLWAAFAGLYIAPVQALSNPDPLLGTPPVLH
jgi:tryptophan-rich sensory protein